MSQTISRDFLVDLSTRAYELDELISSASGTGQSAGKRAQINRMMEANTIDVSPIVSFIDSQDTLSDKVAVWNKIVKAVDAKFEDMFDDFIESLVKTAPAASTVSSDQLETLITERKSISQQWAALSSIWSAIMPGDDISNIPVPKKMTGLRGARGKRPISSYQFSLDGAKMAADENTLSSVAKRFHKLDENGVAVAWKQRDLRDFCSEQAKANEVEFDWKNPPSTFAFTLPGNVNFSGYKMEAPAEPDDADEND